MSLTDMAIRLAVAAICGGVIGFEREHQKKPAGLRTHMLVSLGSTAFTLAALSMEESMMDTPHGAGIQIDPTRIFQGIAGGIGFLGAGAIMRSRGSVQGLTTAATIWVVGALGIVCGIGQYALAAMTTGIAIVIASLLGFIEVWLFDHKTIPGDEDKTDSEAPEPPSHTHAG